MNKQILRLAIPNILSNLSIPLLSSVDTALLGHLEEIVYLGALAVAGIIFNFVYWSFGFLRMGTTGLTAQAYGHQDDREILLILLRTLMIAFVSGMLLIFTDKEHIIMLCMQYMFWIVIAPLTNSFCFIWDGIFIGATATVPMRNSMLFCAFIIFLPIHIL